MDKTMKKALLATTALGMFAASSAFAAGPTVSVGGYADFQLGSASQDSAYEADANGTAVSNTYNRDYHTRTDTEIHISVDGKTDNGLGYGAYIELEADTSADDATGANNNAERTYLYVESGLGRVEAGANGDAGNALRVDASTFARATGGIGGDFYKYIDLDGTSTSATPADVFYVLPGLPTAVMPDEVELGSEKARATANKISYYSPRISGLQAGISFTPDQTERGTSSGAAAQYAAVAGGTTTADFEDVFNAALNYEGQVQGIGVEAAITGETGKAKDTSTAVNSVDDDLKAWSLGLNLSYAGFTVGGSYASIDEFGRTKTANVDADYWTAGAAYEAGPFAASVTYLSSEINNEGGVGVDSEFSNVVVGADYQLAPGLVPYVEVSFFDTDDNSSASADNDGTVFLIGTELNF